MHKRNSNPNKYQLGFLRSWLSRDKSTEFICFLHREQLSSRGIRQESHITKFIPMFICSHYITVAVLCCNKDKNILWPNTKLIRHKKFTGHKDFSSSEYKLILPLTNPAPLPVCALNLAEWKVNQVALSPSTGRMMKIWWSWITIRTGWGHSTTNYHCRQNRL